MADEKVNSNAEDAENKRLDEELRKLNKKESGKIICPICSREVELLWVHGHYQCPFCKNVVVSCCGDS